MLASGQHGTLYAGITNDLARRVEDHKCGRGSSFVRRHGVHTIGRHEQYSDPAEAIRREKQPKKWHRDWKVRLIEEMNPLWVDLYPTLNM